MWDVLLKKVLKPAVNGRAHFLEAQYFEVALTNFPQSGLEPTIPFPTYFIMWGGHWSWNEHDY